ncbi:MAG: hypothetical protein COB22_04970 [Cycloclasticus sp.]|nr:MAG: hypothetical protein COB22_04970 [Cycloclasticus sp.]
MGLPSCDKTSIGDEVKYALCPSCLSSLQVTAEQLALKDGMIRCGHCKTVFDANDNPLPAPITSLDETSKQEAFEQVQLLSEQSLIDDEPSITQPIWEVANEPIKNKPPYLLCSFLLIILFLTQFITTQSNAFTQNAGLQPTFKRLNSAFGFNIPIYKNLSEIHIVERQLSLHPQISQVLLLQLTIKNSAFAEQAFPTINVALTSNSGEKVAYGSFYKETYLIDNEVNDLFKPQELKLVNLIFNKPKKEATGFEISFSE